MSLMVLMLMMSMLTIMTMMMIRTDDYNDHKKDSYTAAGAAPTQTWPDSEY